MTLHDCEECRLAPCQAHEKEFQAWEGLNPAAYRECVEALRSIHDAWNKQPDEVPIIGSLNLMGKIEVALAHAEEVFHA